MAADTDSASCAGRTPTKLALIGSAICYPLLLVGGLALKPAIAIPSALFPPLALAFSIYYLLPVKQWPLVALLCTFLDLLVISAVTHIVTAAPLAFGYSLAVSLSTTLVCLGMVAAMRAGRFGERDKQSQVVAPLMVLALSLGALPGDLLSTWLHARAGHQSFLALDVAIRNLSSVLTVVTLCPLLLMMVTNYAESDAPAAATLEIKYITLAFAFLCLLYFVVPWRLDRFLELMLLAGPLLWAALRCSRRAVAIISAAIAIGIGIACAHGVGQFPPLVSLGNWRDGILSAQMFLLIVCGEALLINQIVLKQNALLKDSNHKRAMLMVYAKALDQAEDEARRAAARDLHDGLAQIIAGQGLILGALRKRIRDTPIRALVDQALDASREAQSAVRAAIVDMSPPEMEHASLMQILSWITEFFALRHRFDVKWEVTGDPSVAAGHLRGIYRAVRELVYNAYKHSQADTAHVLLTLNSSGIQIDVTDVGVGFDRSAPAADGRPRLGLVHLAERVDVVGGSVNIVTSAGKGCRITVYFPLEQPAALR